MRSIQTRSAGRRGVTVVPVLVILALILVLSGVMVRQAAFRRQTLRAEELRMQAEWLAESALERASARLAADPKYDGEVWEVPAADLNGSPGAVRIQVEPVANRPDERRVQVEAEYPVAVEGKLHARQGKTRTLSVSPGNPGGPT